MNPLLLEDMLLHAHFPDNAIYPKVLILPLLNINTSRY